MIHDPERRGRALADFFFEVAPRLWENIEEAGVLPAIADAEAAARVEAEWQCFALYACVRGLVAAGGFNRETGAAIDALHASVLERWMAEAREDIAAFEARRARVAERYAEYGAIGQEGGAAGAESVTERLGQAAARHMALVDDEPLAETVAALHEAMVDGAAEAVRIGE